MANELKLMIVYTKPAPGREKEFNDWYSNVHISEILAVNGFKAAQRFALSPVQFPADRPKFPSERPPSPFPYLTIYEVAGDTTEVFSALKAARENNMISTSDTYSDTSAYLWVPIASRIEAK